MIDNKRPISVKGAEFWELRKGNFYYVDKTQAIRELLTGDDGHVLLTCPRRFGKTLLQSTLRAFLDLDYAHPGTISALRRQIFAGLAITEDEELCTRLMAQHPVIYLSLKTVHGRDFRAALRQLGLLVCQLYTAFRSCFEHADAALISAEEQEELHRYYRLRQLRDADEILELLAPSLAWLCTLLHRVCSRSVYVLIDEYDTPLNEAYVRGYEQDMQDVMRSMFHPLLKCEASSGPGQTDLNSAAVRRCFLTGCLRIGKASIFTEANNVMVLGMEDSRCAAALGFTADEVLAMLDYYELSGSAQAVAEWYDGYRFGADSGTGIYCPWSIASFCAAARHNPGLRPQNYWIDSSSNAILNTLLEELSDAGLQQLRVLLEGGNIEIALREAMTYGELRGESCDACFSLLYLTGYLTRDSMDQPQERGIIKVRIPNEEVRECFSRKVAAYLHLDQRHLPATAAADCTRFLTALEQNDATAAQNCLQELLTAHLPLPLTHGDRDGGSPEREWIYVMFLHFVLLTAAPGHIAQLTMERELGDGRADESFLFTRLPGSGCVLEVKLAAAADNEALEVAAQHGLAQIRERRYGEGMLQSAAPPLQRVLCVGIGCARRKCAATITELTLEK